MNNNNITIKDSLRAMAWERAKGELRSILSTYQSIDTDWEIWLESEMISFITNIEDGRHREGSTW